MSRKLVGDLLGRLHNQVRLPRNWFQPRLPAAVPIGMIDAFNGRPGHQERLQNAVLHHRHRPGLHALVIVGVVAVEIHAIQRFAGGIEHDRKKTGQNRRSNRFGEGLAFGFVLLAMPLDAVTENLVEENRGGASGKNRGTNERSTAGACTSFDNSRPPRGRSIQHRLRGQMRQIGSLKILQRDQVHSIRRFAARHDGKSDKIASVQQPRAFGADHVLGNSPR